MTAKSPRGEGEPQGLALCVGVNKPDPSYYGDEFEPLKGAERDAEEMSRLAQKTGFQEPSRIGDGAMPAIMPQAPALLALPASVSANRRPAA